MNRECIAVDELERVARLPETDPARRHLEACPRCRALLAACLDFLETPELPESVGLRAAEDELAAFLEREVAPGGGPLRRPRDSGRPGLWQAIASGLRPLPVRLALFGAAVAAVFLLVRVGGELPTTPARDPILRGESAASFRAQAVRLADGRLQVQWPAVSGADGYEVVLYGAELTELGRIEAGAGCALSLDPPAAGSAPPPRFYRVVALRSGDVVLATPAQPLPTP